jgi:cell division protein FtsQ
LSTTITPLTPATSPKPAIDPRIRARRVEVQRSEGRRRLRRLAWTAGVLGVLSVLVLLATSPVLDVDRVEVVGAAHSGSEAVDAASRVAPGDRMVTLGLGAAADRIARLPWVREASVTRRWPGTVRITVTERTPVAAVPAKGGGYVLLDAGARQLETVKDAPADLLRVETEPVVAAPGTDLRSGRAAIAVATAVPPVLRERVVALRTPTSHELEAVVKLKNGAAVPARLCTPERIAVKWLALVTMLEQVAPAGVRGLDVCVPESPVVLR